MASKSTTLYPSSGYGYTLSCSFTESLPDNYISTNQTKITASAKFQANGTYWATSHVSTFRLYWHDNNKNTGETLVASGDFAGLGSTSDSRSLNTSFVVDHKEDGTLSGYLRVVFGKGKTTSAQAPASGSVQTNTTTLTTIPRAATLSTAQDFNDTQNPVITYSNPAGSAVTSLKAGIIKEDGTAIVAFRDVGVSNTSYTFSLTNAERTALQNSLTTANSGPVVFSLKTTIGGKTYEKTLTKTLTIINAEPTFSWSGVEEVDSKVLAASVTGGDHFLKGISDVKLTISPSLKKGATLKKVTFTHNGRSLTTNPCTFQDIQNGTFSCTLIDSRGNSTTSNMTLNVLSYVLLNIASVSFDRDASTATKIRLNAKINFYNDSFESIDNTLTIKCKNSAGTTKTISSSSYTISGNTATLTNVDTGFTLSDTSSDTFTLLVNDKVMSAEGSKSVTLLVPTLDMGKSDVQINGTLYVADTSRANRVDILTTLNSVKTTANNANTTANAAPKVFVQSAQPTATKKGDIWFKI